MDEADRSQSIDDRRQFLEAVADDDDVRQGFSLEARLAVAVDVVPQFLTVVVYPIEADDEALQRLQVVSYGFIGDAGRDQVVPMSLDVVIGRTPLDD